MLLRPVVSLCAFAAAAALFGCGGDSSSTDTTEAAATPQELIDAAKPATVELFGKVGDDLVGGTGFVYDAETGRVLTNAHVVEGVSQLQAKVGDMLPTVPARVVGQSPCDDLAVVELVQKPTDLQSLPIGDSDTVQNGDSVIALGYPASFQQAKQQAVSTTEGTVSNPSVVGNQIGIDLPKYPALIAHQAAINPGNSGGPLINGEGEVIGINALTAAPIGNQGQYYAITSNQALTVLPTLESGQSPGYVGWSLVPLSLMAPADLAADYTAAYNTKPSSALNVANDDIRTRRGLYVLSSPDGSISSKSEIFAGDLITSINGTSVQTIPQLCKILQSASPGSTLQISSTALASGEDTDVYGDEFSSTMKVPDVPPPPPAETTSTTSSTSTTTTSTTSTTP